MRTLPQWVRDEREKLRGYGPRDRLKYVWQYYRLWIIGIGFVLCFAAYALWNYFTVPGNIHFYAIFSNTYARLGQGSDFYNGFVKAAGYDLSTGVVEIDCANYCKPSGRATGNTYYEKLISMLDAGVDDVWVAEAEDVIAVGEGGRLMDLNTPEAAALKERYGDRADRRIQRLSGRRRAERERLYPAARSGGRSPGLSVPINEAKAG